MRNSDDSTNQLVVFSDDQLSLEVRVSPKEDTVWLTQAQIAELFEKTPQNITMHIRSIYADEELDRISTCKDFLHVQKEGGRDIERSIKHYNLDLIISVGYRVKSKRGIAFRKWAFLILALRTGIEPFEITQKSLEIKGSLLCVLNFVLNINWDKWKNLWQKLHS